MIDFDEEKHEYSVNGEVVPGVTDILHPITAGGYEGLNPLIVRAAAARGGMVHELLEQYDYGDTEMEVPAELMPYIKAYMDFLRDYTPEWTDIERVVYSPYFGYCGTLDRYGMIDGHPCVVDIKTNGNPTKQNFISVCCQTAAYDEARNGWRGFGRRADEPGNPEQVRRYALYLKPTGDYRLLNCREYEEKNIFSGFHLFYDCLELRKEIDAIMHRNTKEKKDE